MSFVAMRKGEQVDGNREGLAHFLAAQQLTARRFLESSENLELFDMDGHRFTLDGAPTDLWVKGPDAEALISGSIQHAHLGPEELQFIFELCEAAEFFIINHQGGGDAPTCLLLASGSHGPEDLWDHGVGHVTIENAAELGEALGGSFESFLRFRDRALSHRWDDAT